MTGLARTFRLSIGSSAAIALLAVSAASTPVAAASSLGVACPGGATSTIASNFNGTAIAAGSFIWFSAALKVQGVGSQGATITFSKQSIRFMANGFLYDTANASMPDSSVTISPSFTQAATTFDETTRTWRTVTPPNTAGNIFLSGYAFDQSLFAQQGGLPGGISPVTWSGQFASSSPGVSVKWQWAAAVYTAFSTGNNNLGVKPVDDNQASAYKNSDHAGTPENFKTFVVGGARGGGGSNFTGSLSATAGVQLPQCAVGVFVGYADTVHPSGGLPSPWNGAPNTTFVGDGGPYDAGAIRIDNLTTAPITVSSVSVTANNQSFSLWGSFTIPAGGSVILTQTSNHCPGTSSCSDFDTSETGAACGQTPTSAAPTVTLVIGTASETLSDSGRVLDTNGINNEDCGEIAEFHQWVPIGSS
jgi:hypothetical protein